MKGHTRMGWHLVQPRRVLGYRDGRKVKVGETLWIEGKPRLCHKGMHAAPKILDCMFSLATHNSTLADPRPWLCRVRVYDATKHDGNKFVGRGRKVLWMRRLTKGVLDKIARRAGGDTYSTAHWTFDCMPIGGEAMLVDWARNNGCPGLGRATKKRRTK